MSRPNDKLRADREADILRRAAYHEAGHVAAHAFFFKDWSNIVSVSIGLDFDPASNGRFRKSRVIRLETMMDVLPEPWRTRAAACEAICLLSGPAAEPRPVGEVLVWQELAEELVVATNYRFARGSDRPGSDIQRVHQLATLAQPRPAPLVTRQLLDSWTHAANDLVARADVRRAIAKFAEHLLLVKSVECGDELDSFFTAILGKAIRSSKRWAQLA